MRYPPDSKFLVLEELFGKITQEKIIIDTKWYLNDK